MDPARTKTQCPIDDFDAAEDVLVSSVAPRAGERPLAIIVRLLDCLSHMRGKQGWLVLDLMPELHFDDYKKIVPDLNLIVLLRDPAEMATAALYWRTYPDVVRGAGRRLKQTLFSWALSLVSAEALQKRYPGYVTIASTNAVWAGAVQLPDRLADAVPHSALTGAFDGPPYFSLANDGVRFRCPDGRLLPLLGQGQWRQVAFYRERFWDTETAQPKADAAGQLSGLDPRTLGLRIGTKAPYLMKRMADTLLMPQKEFMSVAGTIRGSIAGAIGR